jgi:hypothetical protein
MNACRDEVIRRVHITTAANMLLLADEIEENVPQGPLAHIY